MTVGAGQTRRRRRATWGVRLVAAAAAGLCACASVTTRQPVPDDLPDAFSGRGEQVAADRWWLDCNDSTLSALIEAALADNPGLQVARARLAQAEAVARRQRSELFPAAILQGTASRTEQSDNTPTRRDFTNLSAGGAASYELDLWGRLRSASEAARLDREASRQDLHTAAITLTAQVATTWYQLEELRGQLRVLADQAELNRQILDLVNLRFRRGQTEAADVLRQQQQLESTLGSMATAQAQGTVLEHALALLLGRAPGRWEAPTPAGTPPLPPLPEAGLPADLVRRRPDVVRAYLALLAADQRVAAAVAARFPRLSLSAQASTSGENTGELFHNWLANLAANLALPLIDGGQRRAEVDRTRAVAAEKLHLYEQVVLAALGEVENGLARERQQRAYLASLQRQLELSQQVVERTRDSYTSGAAKYLQVLDVLRTHQQLERTVLTAERQLKTMRIDLYRALAGGWTVAAAPEAAQNARGGS